MYVPPGHLANKLSTIRGSYSRVTYESQGGSGGSTERGVNSILKHFFFLTESAECMSKCKAFLRNHKENREFKFHVSIPLTANVRFKCCFFFYNFTDKNKIYTTLYPRKLINILYKTSEINK